MWSEKARKAIKEHDKSCLLEKGGGEPKKKKNKKKKEQYTDKKV